jgi:hypothetical protein
LCSVVRGERERERERDSQNTDDDVEREFYNVAVEIDIIGMRNLFFFSRNECNMLRDNFIEGMHAR